MMRNTYYKFALTLLILTLAVSHSVLAFAKSNESRSGKQPSSSYKLDSPQKVRLTNVRDTQFTVSWITKGETVGGINYGPTPALGKTAYDDRDEGTEGQVHHITVRHLKPNTLYYFEILSGNKTYRNGEELYTCQTGPSIIPAKCDVAYGRVYQGFGRKHKIYGKEAIVYLTLIDKDGAGNSGESATESTMLEGNGYWSRELANFREEDLLRLFDYSDSGDALKIEVETGIYPVVEVIVDTDSDSPAKDIELRLRRIKR